MLTRTRAVTAPSAPTAPAAHRIRRFRWRDIRLWVGLALMLMSMLAGARLLAGPDGAVTVWRASQDLAVGGIPRAEPVSVQLGDAVADYLPADAPIDGRMLMPVPAGALIPASAVGEPDGVEVRGLTIPVDPLHAPVALTAGDRVDVWATPSDGGQLAAGPPQLVLPSMLVVNADRETVGVGGEIAVVLEVPEADVGTMVDAMRSGVIDLSTVPLAAATS